MTEDSRMEIRDRFAVNLRRARAAKGVSQEDLGFTCDLHRTEISLLERGGREPRLGTLLKLSQALDVSPEELSAGIRWSTAKRRFKISKPR
jgi:transcriptional regulator with XRE-family HTH domain